jgi:hypothetical protein
LGNSSKNCQRYNVQVVRHASHLVLTIYAYISSKGVSRAAVSIRNLLGEQGEPERQMQHAARDPLPAEAQAEHSSANRVYVLADFVSSTPTATHAMALTRLWTANRGLVAAASTIRP